MARTPPSSDRFRVVGPIGAVGIIVSAMVGSGIFTLTGRFGADVGTEANVIAAWVIGGVLALAGGLSLAELGAMIPCSGGSVEFARRAFGRTTGYLVAMVTIVSGYFLSIAAVGLMLAEYVNKIAPEPFDLKIVALAAMVLAFLSQIAGLRSGYAVSTGLSVLKIVFVAAFVVLGLFWPLESRIEPSAAAAVEAPGLFSAAVAAATLSVSFAYLGWSTGADIAGDIERPGRNVPLGIIGAIAVVFVLYIGMNLVYLRVIDPLAMTEPDGGSMQAIGAVTVMQLMGATASKFAAAIIALLFFATIVSGTITAARILESMAHAGEINGWAGVRTRHGVPMAGLVITLAASAACLLIGSLDEIFGLLTVLINIFSSLSVAAVIVLRRTMPDAPRPFRVPLYPVTPLVYLALAGWTVVASVMEGGWRAVLSSVAVVAVLLAVRPLLALGRAKTG